LRELRPFDQHVLVRIGKTPAIGRARFIDTAKIVLAQKGTGHRSRHPIALLVLTKIFIGKLAFPDVQEFGDAFDIRPLEPRGEMFAAIGALGAVHPAKSFLMQTGQKPQHFFLIGLLQILFVSFLMLRRTLLPILQWIAHPAKIADPAGAGNFNLFLIDKSIVRERDALILRQADRSWITHINYDLKLTVIKF
jgi:hypothetical protein